LQGLNVPYRVNELMTLDEQESTAHNSIDFSKQSESIKLISAYPMEFAITP